MIFLGTTFFSGRNILDPSPAKTASISKISIRDGTYDQIFVSKNPDLEVEDGYSEWDFDTVMNADYDNGHLDAGNSGFSLNNTDTVIIKCREKGTMDWTTIYAKDIHKVEDFSIRINDYYRPGNKDFEYMVVSVCNGAENSYIARDIHSVFDCLCICDKDNIYGTIYDLDYMDTTVNTSNTVVELLNNEYPAVISNSPTHYESCTTTGAFIKLDQDKGKVDSSSGLQYRSDIKKWFNNRKPKILKFYDGRIWLINIKGVISDVAKGHNDLRQLSFEWVEIGNVNDMKTLYECGLSDVSREWWY